MDSLRYLILLSDCWQLPFRVTHLLLLQQLLLALPKLSATVGVAPSVKGPNVLGDVRLVLSDNHLSRPLKFVLEPSVGHSQI